MWLYLIMNASQYYLKMEHQISNYINMCWSTEKIIEDFEISTSNSVSFTEE